MRSPAGCSSFVKRLGCIYSGSRYLNTSISVLYPEIAIWVTLFSHSPSPRGQKNKWLYTMISIIPYKTQSQTKWTQFVDTAGLTAFYQLSYKVLISFSGVTNHIHYEPRQVVTIIIITRQPERRTFFWYPMCLLKTTLKMLLSVSSLLDWWSFWRSTGFCTFCLVIFYSCLNCILGKHAAVKFNWRKGEMFCDFPAKKKKWQISSKKKR